MAANDALPRRHLPEPLTNIYDRMLQVISYRSFIKHNINITHCFNNVLVFDILSSQ